MNISIIGAGYVGLTTATCFAELGMDVLCMDTDEHKIGMLADGVAPMFEPDLEDMIKSNLSKKRLMFTNDMNEAVNFGDVIFLAVGTPSKSDDSADLQFVFKAVEDISACLRGYKVIVVKSTVPVGTGKKIGKEIKDILEDNSSTAEFDMVSNPEFLRQGSAIYDFMHPDRIVIGTEGDKAREIMLKVYEHHSKNGTPIIMSNIETAEMIKYVSNAFLATKISFINEIANMCEKCNVDISIVAKAMGMDERIGPKFLNPGPGYGGSCFPKDTKALLHIGRTLGYAPKIIESVIKVNKHQHKIMVKKIEAAINGFDGKVVTILGVSFKPNTDDMREAPSIPIIRHMIKHNARVKIYDPKAMEKCRVIIKDAEYCKDLLTACTGSDCIVLVTEWDEFKSMNLEKIRSIVNSPVLIDLRNIFDPALVRKAGFSYEGVGRR